MRSPRTSPSERPNRKSLRRMGLCNGDCRSDPHTGLLGDLSAETAENIIRPERKVTIDSIIYSTIGELKKESKIVVMTGEVNLSVKRSHTKFFSRLNLGTTAVEVLVPKNKIQYVIPTDAISEESFRWNDETGEVSIEIPTPVIDEEIVEIQSDPELIKVKKDIGWGEARISFRRISRTTNPKGLAFSGHRGGKEQPFHARTSQEECSGGHP